MNKAPFLFLLLALVWGTSSCNFYRRITGRKKTSVSDSAFVLLKDSTQLSVPDTSIVRKDSIALPPIQVDSTQQALLQNLLPLWNKQTTWTTFNGRAKAHLEGKVDVPDFTAQIRMEKGKGIWISVNALLPIEAFRVLITADTVHILDRLRREVRSIPFSEIGSLIPIRADFPSLQSLIIGDALQTGHLPTTAKDTAGALILSHISPDFMQSLQFNRGDSTLHFQYVAAATASMLCEYSDWTAGGPQRFANNRNLTLTDKGESSSLSLEFNKAAFDEPVEMPFSVPDSYNRK
jgi:hypothetical protein